MKPTGSEALALPLWETAVSTLEPQLLYRGYPAEELAESSHFLETAYLLVAGELPPDEQLADWQALLFDARCPTQKGRQGSILRHRPAMSAERSFPWRSIAEA